MADSLKCLVLRVKKPQAQKSEKVSKQGENMKAKRNDPCPCGSGKKYKKCCLEKEQKTGFNAKLFEPGGASSMLANFFKEKIATNKPTITKSDEKKEND
jgi:hypothetical protein